MGLGSGAAKGGKWKVLNMVFAMTTVIQDICRVESGE